MIWFFALGINISKEDNYLSNVGGLKLSIIFIEMLILLWERAFHDGYELGFGSTYILDMSNILSRRQ